MSKCDVRIDFDRSDRTFRGGETVTGRVYVAVNQDVNSHGVVLEHFWRTHGSGNTATGDKSTTQLYAGPLQAGQALELPFDVVAPHGPPTYHGHYLNIDHYLQARVDIPWTFDPKAEEEYLLAPSGEPYGELPPEVSQVGKAGCRQAGMVVGAVFVFFGIIIPFPVGILAIPIGGLILFFALRRKLAEKRLGQVQVTWGPAIIAPGSVVPVRVALTPAKAMELKEIRLKLMGREMCVSGSGTNSTTHLHRLHEETVRLAGTQRLAAHQPVEFAAEVLIPDTPAYTFYASDNRLEWEAELTIDLPMWPNWVEKKQLVIRATPQGISPEVAADRELLVTGSQNQMPTEEYVASDLRDGSSTRRVIEPEVGSLEAVPGDASQAQSTSNTPQAAAGVVLDPLVQILTAIHAESRYSQERERIAQRHSGQSHLCDMTIRRTERTYDYDAKEPYRNGRTVHGTVIGTSHEVVIQMKAAGNDQVDRLRSGDEFQCHATVVKWNSVYDRLEMREA